MDPRPRPKTKGIPVRLSKSRLDNLNGNESRQLSHGISSEINFGETTNIQLTP